MSIIQAITIDGITYEKTAAKSNYTCDECDLDGICIKEDEFSFICGRLACKDECWKKLKRD